MNKEPLVSIAIPAFKDKYLGVAIESILAQTFKNFELIIVNDASPNSITEVVEKYNDSRIKYFVNEQNIGGQDPVANWNKCLSYAQGDYFALLCDDDIYEPTFLEKMLDLADSYPNCNVFKSGVSEINEKKEIVNTYPESPSWESCVDYIRAVYNRNRKQTISEWFFRKQHIINCGGYETVPMAWGADYLSIFIFSKDGGIASTNEKLVTFRRSGINITTSRDNFLEKKLLGSKIYAEKLFDFVVKNELMQESEIKKIVHYLKDSEQKGALSVASPYKIWSIRKEMGKSDIKAHVWLWAITKNIIKLLVRR